MEVISFILAVIASLGIYPMSGRVCDIDNEYDIAFVATDDGQLWAFDAEEHKVGDRCSLIVWDSGTPDDVEDDYPVVERWFVEW